MKAGSTTEAGRSTLALGVVGTGGMGYQHCKNITQHVPEAKLVAVCDSDPATAARVGTEFQVPSFTGHRELTRSGLCQALLVATPHPSHAPIAIDAMKAGLHVLSEKPLTENIATAEQMVRTARRQKVTLAVMFQWRFSPACGKALELARRGELGRIQRATLIAPDYRSQAYYDAGQWRATWVGEGGGVLLNQAPHILDFFVNLVGLPKSVRGTVAARLHDIEVEDVAEATLTLADGGTGYVYCSTDEPGPGATVEVFGDHGKLIFRDGKLHFYKFTPPVREFTRANREMWARPKCEEVPLELKPGPAGHAAVVSNFARHILAGEELVCGAESGLGQLELANAIILSGHTGRPVKLPLSRKAYSQLLAKLRRTSRHKDKKVAARRITDPNFAK